MVKTLFEQGANPDLQDIFGKSPLHVAAAKGNIAVIKPLIEEILIRKTKMLPILQQFGT